MIKNLDDPESRTVIPGSGMKALLVPKAASELKLGGESECPSTQLLVISYGWREAE